MSGLLIPILVGAAMGTGIIVSTTAILELCERKVRDIHTAPEQECVATSPAPAHGLGLGCSGRGSRGMGRNRSAVGGCSWVDSYQFPPTPRPPSPRNVPRLYLTFASALNLTPC